jgi:hypothetical protein
LIIYSTAWLQQSKTKTKEQFSHKGCTFHITDVYVEEFNHLPPVHEHLYVYEVPADAFSPTDFPHS